MKRTRSEEFTSPQRRFRGNHFEQLEDCTFFDFLYEQRIKESEEFVASKLREIEREMDELPTGSAKEAYLEALKQEIKQKTHYVRSKEFLLLFLRTETFDARKAAIRLSKFLQYKLELFGAEKLPHRIVQDDLNEFDKKVLSSGFIHLGLDCRGRIVFFFHLQRLYLTGLCEHKYVKNILRALMYQFMFAVEDSDKHKNEVVGISWRLNFSEPIRDYRLFYTCFDLEMFALPVRFVASYTCNSYDISRICSRWVESLMQKYSNHLFRMFGPTAASCLADISKYGVDVLFLPISSSGDFNDAVHQKQIQEMQRKEREVSSRSICKVKDTNNHFDPKFQFLTKNEVPSIQFMVENSLYELNSNAGKQNPKTSAQVSNYEISEPIKFGLPYQLMELLQSNKYQNALWWSNDGRSFAIHKEHLCENVLAKEFKGIQFNSFLRNIRRWGFQRVLRGDSNILEYHHHLFRRNTPQLLRGWNLKHGNSHKQVKFPITLMKAINSNKESDAIWWECDGEAFAINNKIVANLVLNKYFRGMQLSSFHRSLRRWGFKRLFEKETVGNDHVMFYQHFLFKKGSLLSPDKMENWTYLDE